MRMRRRYPLVSDQPENRRWMEGHRSGHLIIAAQESGGGQTANARANHHHTRRARSTMHRPCLATAPELAKVQIEQT